MNFDWSRTFTQAEVLQLVPKLKAKSLQNWNERGMLDWSYENGPRGGPGKGGRRNYTALDLVTLAFMVELTDLGHPANSASALAWDARQQAEYFVERSPLMAHLATGQIVQPSEEQLRNLTRAWIRPNTVGSWFASFGTVDDYFGHRDNRFDSCICVDVDALAIRIVNRIARSDGSAN